MMNHHRIDRRLDCLVELDPASREHPYREARNKTRKPIQRIWDLPITLDQGREGACVGFAWAHELAATPVPISGIDNRFARDEIYRPAQGVDQWAGEDYEGTSVLAGAKICRRLGFIGEYRWAFSMSELVDAVCYHGPVVLGIPWHKSMYYPRVIGGRHYIKPNGVKVGHHALLAIGYDPVVDAVALKQSWGDDHGDHGVVWIRTIDLDPLRRDEGVCCVPELRSDPPRRDVKRSLWERFVDWIF